MFIIDSDGRRNWVDGSDGYNDLSDEKKDSLNRCSSYHREDTLDNQINSTRKSSTQYTIINQRRNKR